jgi:hypothetical protein
LSRRAKISPEHGLVFIGFEIGQSITSIEPSPDDLNLRSCCIAAAFGSIINMLHKVLFY